MTTFENLELIYHEFMTVSDSIMDLCINKDDYNSATEKIEQKDSLMKKLLIAINTSTLTKEEQLKIDELNKKINESEENFITYLKENKLKVKTEIDKTKKKVKISSAYVIPTNNKQGVYLDVEE